MLYSMTGYGSAEANIGDYQCMLELKALNGKQLDVYTKIPQNLKALEIKLRQEIKQELKRGSIEVIINLKQNGASKPLVINKDLVAYYLKNIEEISTTYGIEKEQILPTIMRMPEIVSYSQDLFSETEEEQLIELLKTVCDKLTSQRAHEGKMLFELLDEKVKNIELLSEKIEPLDAQRSADKKDKIQAALQDQPLDSSFDKNRLEQEIIYYIEKLDISEERVRLKHHCTYFQEILNNSDDLKGKKLGFIAQEIGREINTLGAKANHSEIQKIVVQMKDELEQIKEQVANAL
jgi:uncharacterized protein (TIGR00255 family)